MKNLKIIFILMTAFTLVFVAGCDSELDEKLANEEPQEMPTEFVDITIQPGENPPDPYTVDADYATDERRDPGDVDLTDTVDFAQFTSRWNEAVSLLEREDFLLGKIDIRYLGSSAYTSTTISMKMLDQMDFIYISTNIEYDSNYLFSLTVGFDASYESNFRDEDMEDVIDAWKALIYAANPDMDTMNEASFILTQLGISDLDAGSFLDIQTEETIDGYTYQAETSSSHMGSLRIYTVPSSY